MPWTQWQVFKDRRGLGKSAPSVEEAAASCKANIGGGWLPSELVKIRFNFHGMRTELEIRTNKGEGAEEREISFEKHQYVFEHSTSLSQVHKRTRKAGYGAG